MGTETVLDQKSIWEALSSQYAKNELISESDKERILLNVRKFLLTKTVPSNIIMQEE